MKILITGSSGLVGLKTQEFLQRKYPEIEIYCLVRKKTDTKFQIEMNLSSDWKDEILPKSIDVIIHLAQSENFRDFPNAAADIFSVNTISTVKLLDYAKKAGAKKFIYASSGGVYGTGDTGFTEESPIQPPKDLGFYLTTKYCSELVLANYTTFFDINILRFFFVYGQRQKNNMLIPRLIHSVKNSIPIQLSGNEGIKINPICVDDAANTILQIIKKEGSFNLNVGGTEIISIKELAEKIATYVGIDPIFSYQENKAKNLIGDISKLKLIYTPVVNLNEGLKKTIANE